MSRKRRLMLGVIFAVMVFVSSAIPAFAASSKDGNWRTRPIIVLCEGNPTACPCPGC